MQTAKTTEMKRVTPQKSEPKLKAAERKPFIFGVQETIADDVAEMISTGTSSTNLKLLSRIVVDHRWRRKFGNHSDCGEEYMIRETANLLDELAVARTARKYLDVDERPEPADLVARIRERAREECADGLQDFLNQANPEELRLMQEVMVAYRSAHNNDLAYGELGIASAFMEQVNQKVNYVRVPEKLLADVENYIHALIKAYPGKEA
jgi:hypothetical protein